MILNEATVGMKSISPSKLQTYLECPKLFYYRDWLGLKLDQDKMHMEFGNSVQRAIEFIYLLYDNNFGGAWEAEKKTGWQQVEDRFAEHWKLKDVPEESFQKFLTTKAGKESGFTKHEDLFLYMWEDGIAILKSYWENKEMLIAQHGLDLDEFEIKMWTEIRNPVDPKEKLDIAFSGRIDGKNRDFTKLIDFKTSKGKWDEQESRKLIQCRAYPYMWLMKYGKFIPNFDYIVLRKGLKNPNRVEVVSLKFDEADMLSFYVQVKSILTSIANREFEAPRSNHASWCECKKFEEELSIIK